VATQVQEGIESIDGWYPAYDDAVGEMERLVERGTWLRGSTSLMRIVRAHRSELHHSRALGWLLDPLGTHRLGPRFLVSFLELANASSEGFAPARTVVTLEVPTHDPKTKRNGSIDVLVRCGTHQLVIENKWDASETNDQLDRYWRGTGGAGTYVYLTLDGASPQRPRDSEGVWVQVSWRSDVAPLLSALVANHPDGANAPVALHAYLETLQEVL
jgi:hypothetical protein